ncbi:Mitochondrial distribution and morphology protein 12 [Ceratocystis pirilliformis]|uniref:Mitochondrial distribution and morphology protein 12 n=1 Tax=Ceratocystis pirilliformis TaxID=259994 RepID=A0ABR3YZ47_9PEZI
MSIDLNWDAITSGPEGDLLALRIRDFIHEKFQTVPLPRFLKSVKVHSFSFGDIAPELELKDITDPLPDFYEENPDVDDSESEKDEQDLVPDSEPDGRRRHTIGGRDAEERFRDGLSSNDSQYWRATTPGVPGGTSNMHYFQQTHLGASWSGAHTPLAAVAGAHLSGPWNSGSGGGQSTTGSSMHIAGTSYTSAKSPPGSNVPAGVHSRAPSIGSVTSAADEALLAEMRDARGTMVSTDEADVAVTSQAGSKRGGDEAANESETDSNSVPRYREPRPEDVQIVFRIRYAGDIRLLLTAEILLDYPMPSFVGIPVKLNVTGLTFDGVGVLAHIRRRVHFCFLSPEDALAAVGPDSAELGGALAANQSVTSLIGGAHREKKFGGLLQEIRVESEIGQRESGKQSLKNVGKVERFVLEQVRRIFEDEFVYPSFWTFLV